MNKKLLLCVVLICTMLVQTAVVSFAGSLSYISYEEAAVASITNLRILDDNKLPDGTAIDASKHVKYFEGGFKEGGQHVADRTFTLSGIADTDLIGSDLIGWGYDTYKPGDTVQSYVFNNHNVNNTPGILNWINFTVTRDAEIYVYTSLEDGQQVDNDRALKAAGFTHVGKNADGWVKSSVAIANNTYYGKWVKTVKAGDSVSLPSNRSGSNPGRVTPIAVIKYTSGKAGGINSGAYVSSMREDAKLYTAVYDENGNVVGTNVSSGAKNGYLSTSIEKTGSQMAKSFLWTGDKLTPVTSAASVGDLDGTILDLVDIRINGEDASSFIGTAIVPDGSYDIGIRENGLHSIPKVTATTNDSGISVAVKTYPDELKTVVRIAKGALNAETETVTLPNGTTMNVKRENMASTTVTFNWVKDYITMSDFVPATSESTTSSNWNPLTFKTLNKKTVKNVTVADGSFKKVQVKFANLNQFSTIIAVQPAAESSKDAKTILCDSTGAAVTFNQDDTTVVMGHARYADNWTSTPGTYKAYRSTSPFADAAGTTAKAHYPIFEFTPGGYQLGSRIAINQSPRFGLQFLWSLGASEKDLAGSAYFVFDGHNGADKVMTFWVADDAVISVLSQDTTVTFSEDGGAYTAGTVSAADTKIANERKVSDTDVAWLLLNNIIETNDIYNQTWQNGYYARRLYRADVLTQLPEHGYTIKGYNVTTGTQYTHILDKFVADYKFDADVGLVTDFVNYAEGAKHNSGGYPVATNIKPMTAWPPQTVLADREGTKNNNGTGAVISWPAGLGLENYDYYIPCIQDYSHLDAEDFGGTYSGGSYPFYSFKLNRDAVVAVFSKWIYGAAGRWDADTKTPAFSKDAGWDYIEFPTSEGLVVSQVRNDSSRPLHELFIRKYKAGDTVTIYTPNATEFVIPFIKECEQTAIPDVDLKSIKIDGVELAGFDPETYTYTYAVPANKVSAPKIEALAKDGNAWVTVLNPTEFPGSAKINVVCADGSVGTYTINYTCSAELADNVVGDPDVTNWSTHNATINGNKDERPVILKNLQVGSVIIHDRYSNAAAKVTALDSSLAGCTYLTVGHDWKFSGSTNGDFDEVYRNSALNTDWYTFDIHRNATIKIVHKGAADAKVTAYLEENGYTYNGKSSGSYLSAFNPTVNNYICDTMYYKHFEIPEGQDKLTIAIPSLITNVPFVVVDFDDYK